MAFTELFRRNPKSKRSKKKLSDKIGFLVSKEGRKPAQAGALAFNLLRKGRL